MKHALANSLQHRQTHTGPTDALVGGAPVERWNGGRERTTDFSVKAK